MGLLPKAELPHGFTEMEGPLLRPRDSSPGSVSPEQGGTQQTLGGQEAGEGGKEEEGGEGGLRVGVSCYALNNISEIRER